MCIRVELYQTKNGLFGLVRLVDEAFERAVRNSRSTVSMRLAVSGPVSSHFCLPQAPKRGSSPARPASVA